MLKAIGRLLRLDRLERRLFGWMLLLALVPLVTLLLVVYVVSARSLAWVGTLGPWDHVAESGRALIEAAEPASDEDAELARALEAHRVELSRSLLLARRWQYLLDRLGTALPVLGLMSAVLLIAATLWIGRRLAVQLARPILELVGWAERMARGEPLPAATAPEQGEVRELRALRDALRLASVQIGEARGRAVEAERVRAWGEMARRVAHEMKNPLTPLRLAAHRLAQHPDAAGGLREPIEVIEEETRRLEELARQFAVLGRPSAGAASEVDVRELLEQLLASDVPQHVTTRLHVAGGVPLIRAHYDALQRAFRNLIRNAVEAIAAADAQLLTPVSATGATAAPLPGLRSGRTMSAVAPPQITVTVTRCAPDRIWITMADTGCGIPADRIDRLFEPDFTLKAGGTGLGLAVVRQAIAAHGGTVRARSRAVGAEFIVELPLGSAGA
jgi:nitrogen fixation/metabolism regulation signal transduction histidine kinase